MVSGKQKSEIQSPGRGVVVASTLRGSRACERSVLGQQG